MKLAIAAGLALLLITPVDAARAPRPSAFELLWADYQTQGHVAVERTIRMPADYLKIEKLADRTESLGQMTLWEGYGKPAPPVPPPRCAPAP